MPHPPHVRLPAWLTPALRAAAGLSLFSGFASFGVTAALGDVALAFGEPDPEASITAMTGLAATTVTVGLAIIRLASLGALPLSGVADRLGRRRVIIGCTGAGLACTFLTAFSPSFWVFVAVFALARPLLSATNALAAVIAAEETHSADRSRAIATISVGYALGAGLTALVRLGIPSELGFRGLFGVVLLPVLLLPLARRWLGETPRFRTLATVGAERPTFGTVPAGLRARLGLVCLLTAGIGFVTGPFTQMLFLYGENALGMSSGAMAGIFVASAPAGLVGILVGRWAADTVGRRPTAGLALAVVAGSGAVIYSGAPAGVAVGYILSILAASMYTPAAGSLDAELFPTSVRATAAGWITAANVLGAVAGLLAFGLLLETFGAFRPAAVALAVPVVLLSSGYALLPETLGRELEDVAPAAGPR